jgi:hypothetical protein
VSRKGPPCANFLMDKQVGFPGAPKATPWNTAPMPETQLFPTANPWNPNRPHVLVVACSDGRLQEPLDDFLSRQLGISHYDRLYLPGGPGALSCAGVEFMRASRMADEIKFLIEAHKIEDVILMYHGPGEDGPDEAICADYRRIYRWLSAAEIRKQQERDTEEIILGPLRNFPKEHIHPFRMEVNAQLGIDVRSLRGL